MPLAGLAVTVFRIVPFIATLATMTACRGMTVVFSRAKAQYLAGDIQNLVMRANIAGVPVLVICMFLIFILGDIVLRQTPFGRQLYAIGHNDIAAENIGIKVTIIKFTAYLIAGITAGIAGLISAVRVGAGKPALGLRQEFIVISCAVLGGVSLFGGKGHVLPGGQLFGVVFGSLVVLKERTRWTNCGQKQPPK